MEIFTFTKEDTQAFHSKSLKLKHKIIKHTWTVYSK